MLRDAVANMRAAITTKMADASRTPQATRGADRLELRVAHQKNQVAKFYFRALRLISTARRRCSAFSNWFTRLVRSASCLSKVIIRLRAMILSSATKKEPSPLTIARPLVAEAG